MGVEKQGSKVAGGYVGGFLHLFDWNAKSRKKLFSSKNDLPEQSKQKKRSDGNFPMTRIHLMDEDCIAAGSSLKGSSDYSCASSVTDEDVCGIKGPGVVARLMGLDSLPTANFSDTYSNPSFDSQSLRDAHFSRKNLDGCQQNNQLLHSGNLLQAEVPLRNAIEPKPQKMMSRPIEKFQTETLPPKSAKLIPTTHHKLLSPIKSPGFVPSKNAVHIMEAAAKILESGRQATSMVKTPLVGSSSAPFKVRDLKEKVETASKPSKLGEASRRPVESNAAKYLKGQSMNKSWNGSVDSKPFKVLSEVAEEYSSSSKSKGKSISLALQAKVNVQKREGLNLGDSRSVFGHKEEIDVTTSRLPKSQPNTQRNTHKRPSMHNSSNVLRQNNQKQNCLADRGKVASKSLNSNSQSQKLVSGDSSFGRQKNSSKISVNSKVGSRKLCSGVTDSRKEVPYSTTNTITNRKRSIDGDFHLEKNQVLDNIDRSRKIIQSNPLAENQFGWVEESKRKGMDVVSFTFTAPMARSIPSPETSREVLEKNSNGFYTDFRGKKALFNIDGNSGSKIPSFGFNVIGGDALSTLLEQKLRELTNGADSSRHRAETASSSASIFHDTTPTFKAGSTTPLFPDKSSQGRIHTDDLSSHFGSGFSSTDPLGLMRKHKPQVMEDAYKFSCNDNGARKLQDCRHPSPVSVLEPSSTESCTSSDTADSNSDEVCKQSSSFQAQEVLGMSFPKKLNLMDADTELSDSASSTSTGKQVGSANRELDYVKEILCRIEPMFKDFALGWSSEIINPNIFHHLEAWRLGQGNHGNEPKLRRKVLFDCVSECMDSRCRVWARGLAVVRRKEWLAKEVYKEISGWESMGACMVDEIVDKDMSGGLYGRWLDFKVEEFELGVEIESRILNSLVNEVVADILLP